MIVFVGGGVLAYTLLGVDVNSTTGEVLFLILDPHFVGQDLINDTNNMKQIKEKGWCAWKTATAVFKNNYFYNLLLPQRLNQI